MRTKVQPIGDGFSAWNLRALWVSLTGLAKRGEADCHISTSEVRGRTSIFPTIAPRPTVTRSLEKQRLAPTRINGGQVSRSTAGRHLWLVLSSEEHRRGALWETAGFLAIWLAGLIGVAICVLG